MRTYRLSPALLALLLLAAPVLATSALAAESWIYWIREGEIGRLATDGSENETILGGSSTITSILYDPAAERVFWTDMDTGKVWRGEALGGERNVLEESPGMPGDLEMSEQWLFWIDREYGLRRMARPRGEAETIVEKQRYDGPTALGVAAGKLYWTDTRDAWLRRADFDGTGVEMLLDLGEKRVQEFEILDDRVYWKGGFGKTLHRARMDGSEREVLAEVQGRASVDTFEISGGHLYWILNRGISGSVIQRADLDGRDAATLDLPNVKEPFMALAVAGSRVYWAEAHTGRLMSVGLDRSDPRVHIRQNVADPSGIVVLGDSIYWSQEALGFSRSGLIRVCSRQGGGVERDLVYVSERREPTALVTLDGWLFWLERSWLNGTTSRLVGADPAERDPEPVVLVDGLDRPNGLVALDGWLYWLDSSGEIRRVRPDGSGEQKVRSLPAKYRDRQQRYESLAADGSGAFYVGEESQDAVHRTRGRSGREILANDLYLSHLFAFGSDLYWSGVEGLGRISLESSAVETLSDLPRVEAIFVISEAPPGDG